MVVAPIGRLWNWALRFPSWKAILVGLLIREAFSFWTGHPYDTEVWIRTAYAVDHGHNPYISEWTWDPALSIQNQQLELPSAAYLPFWPSLLGGLYALWTVVGGGNRFVFYWLIKQPPILGDLVSGLLLFRVAEQWTSDSKRATAVLWIWMLFPYDIVVSAIWGQFDSIVVCLILALFLVRTPLQRNVLYGLGILVKWVTVVFLPLELFRSRGRDRLLVLVAIALPLALTGLAFFAFHWGLQGIQDTTTSESHGNGGGMNWQRLVTLNTVMAFLTPRVPGFYLAMSYLWVPVVLGLGYWIPRRMGLTTGPDELTAYTLIVAGFLLARSPLNEQYMLYLFPLMILDFSILHPERRGFYEFLWVLCFAFMVLNNTLGIWFLTPISASYNTLATSLDASRGFGDIRTNSLNAFAILISITLAQLVYLIVRRREEWSPWPVLAARWFQGRFRRAAGAAGV